MNVKTPCLPRWISYPKWKPRGIPEELYALNDWASRTVNEAKASELISAILDCLGYIRGREWEVSVKARNRELPVNTKSSDRADFVVAIPLTDQKLLIEAKRPRERLNSKWLGQITHYAQEIRPYLCVWTTGLVWHVWKFHADRPSSREIQSVRFHSKMSWKEIERVWADLTELLGAHVLFAECSRTKDSLSALTRHYKTLSWFDQSQYGMWLARDQKMQATYLKFARRLLARSDSELAAFGGDLAAQLMLSGDSALAYEASEVVAHALKSTSSVVRSGAFQSLSLGVLTGASGNGLQGSTMIPPDDAFGMVCFIEYLQTLVFHGQVPFSRAEVLVRKVAPYKSGSLIKDICEQFRSNFVSPAMSPGHVLGGYGGGFDVVLAIRKMLLLAQSSDELEASSAVSVLSAWIQSRTRKEINYWQRLLSRDERMLFLAIEASLST